MARYVVPFTELREINLSLDVVQLVDAFMDSHVIRIAHGLGTSGIVKEGYNIPSREEFLVLAHQIIEVTKNDRRRERKEFQGRERRKDDHGGERGRGSGTSEAGCRGGGDHIPEGGDGSHRAKR